MYYINDIQKMATELARHTFNKSVEDFKQNDCSKIINIKILKWH
jgi:hypothetical protein